MNRLNIVLIVLILVLSAFFIYDYLNRPKTAYVIIGEVFNEFSMKKDLEKKYTATKNVRQKVLDSIAIDLRILTKKIDIEKGKNEESVNNYNLKREEFYQKQKNFQQDNEALTKQYDQEILTQLNQYVKDYGKENHYQYIFGNDNNGSLMYAEETKNLTKQITEYINQKYKGLK